MDVIFIINYSHLEKLIKQKPIRKKADKFQFFILSSEIYTDGSFPNLESLEMLLPSNYLTFEYVEGTSKVKKLNRRYIKDLEDNEECYVGILNLLLTVSNGKIPIIVLGDEELELGFVDALIKHIKNEFGVKVKVITHKDIEDVLSFTGEDLDEEKLTKILKHHRHLIDSNDIVDMLEEMSKKELRKLIREKYKMSKADFGYKFGEDYKKSTLIKFILGR